MTDDNIINDGNRLIDDLRIFNDHALEQIAQMHLLFLLDLNGSSLEEFMNCETKRNEKKLKTNEEGIFTKNLTEEGICRLYLLIDFLNREENINQVGIFRVCGSSLRQQELKHKLSQGIHINLDDGVYTAHDCANVLKSCLSELPEPLLTEAHCNIHSQIQDRISRSTDKEIKTTAETKRLKVLQLLVILLPITIQKFVKDLIYLLHNVAMHVDKNKMDSKSLATLFAPHLICPKNCTPENMQKTFPVFIDELCFIIENVEKIYTPPLDFILDVRSELHKHYRTRNFDSSLSTSKNITTPSINNDNEDTQEVNTVMTFCSRIKQEEMKKSNFTDIQLAELYAHVQSLPDTPAKNRLVKQFNRQNGGKSPLPSLKRKNITPCKNAIRSIGGQIIKAGRNIFSTSSATSTPVLTKKCTLGTYEIEIKQQQQIPNDINGNEDINKSIENINDINNKINEKKNQLDKKMGNNVDNKGNLTNNNNSTNANNDKKITEMNNFEILRLKPTFV